MLPEKQCHPLETSSKWLATHLHSAPQHRGKNFVSYNDAHEETTEKAESCLRLYTY